MPDLPKEAVEAVERILPAAACSIAGDDLARRLAKAAAPAIREQERERYQPVVAAARRLLRMHHGARRPSYPAGSALYSALDTLEADDG